MAKKMNGRRSTIYDIAVVAQTSPATVSLVLNGSWERYRINADTAERVVQAAKTVGYHANQRARGLRLSRSNLSGMVIPHYRNRFFAGLAEVFEQRSRERGLCPIVVSTQRDPATERSVVETLLAQQVDCLIISGVDRPEALNALCRDAGVPCVNLDLPGAGAPCVVTDNRAGALELTARLVDQVARAGGDPAAIRFVGGRAGEYATEMRVEGFLAALAERGVALAPERVERCGYQPDRAREAIARAAAGDHPAPGLFINSITAFEGFAALLREGALPHVPAVACFDWDPFAAALSVPVMMMRQNVDALIDRCFEAMDERREEGTVMVPPRLAFAPPEPADARPAPIPTPEA